MTHWETIQDRSAHLSQVKLVPPKNYSVERGNGIFDAVSKTSIPINKPHLSQQQKNKHKTMFKSVYLNYLIFFLINMVTVTMYWQCSKSELNSNSICVRVNNTLDMPYVWINDTKNLIQQHVTQPLISRWNENPYHWIDTTTETIQVLGNKLKETSDQAVQNHIKPLYQSTHEKMIIYYHSSKKVMYKWMTWIKQQLDDYVNHGGHDKSNEIKETDTVVEEKIKKTAKRILNYINQLNQENVQTGMKADQAKKKAQEIIKSITKESNLFTKEQVESIVMEKTEDNIIESIMEVATTERIQLKQKLELLQSYLTMDTIQDNNDLLITALKLEIEQLRADAENNVREKTKQVLLLLDSSQQETIQQAQKIALKDLRKVYRDIYQTNQMIDNLVLS